MVEGRSSHLAAALFSLELNIYGSRTFCMVEGRISYYLQFDKHCLLYVLERSSKCVKNRLLY